MKRVIVVFLAFCSLPSTALALSQPTTTFTTRVRNCAGYANYWEEHLLTEYREASNELKERRRTWSRKQLEDAGICIFGAAAMVSFIESKVVAGPHKQRICCSSLTFRSTTARLGITGRKDCPNYEKGRNKMERRLCSR